MNSLTLEAPPGFIHSAPAETVALITADETKSYYPERDLLRAYKALTELFEINRLSAVTIRTHTGTHLASPLAMKAKHLAVISLEKPNTEDEHLMDYVAEILDSAIELSKRSKSFSEKSFFSDVTRVIAEALRDIREGKDFVVREVSITWLDDPQYFEVVEEPVALEELPAESLRDLIERWRNQEPGTFPPPPPES